MPICFTQGGDWGGACNKQGYSTTRKQTVSKTVCLQHHIHHARAMHACYTSQLKYVFWLEENVSRVIGQNFMTP